MREPGLVLSKIGKIWIVTLLVLGLTLQTVKADECSKDFDFPAYTKVTVEGEVQYCFKVAPLKSILVQLGCGKKAHDQNEVLEKKINLHLSHIFKLESMIVSKDDLINSLQEDKERLHNKWKEENKKRHEEENKATYGWIGWTAAAIFATSTVSLGVAFILK